MHKLACLCPMVRATQSIAAAHESGLGTTRTFHDVRTLSASGARADIGGAISMMLPGARISQQPLIERQRGNQVRTNSASTVRR
jgi:hypothetical protein